MPTEEIVGRTRLLENDIKVCTFYLVPMYTEGTCTYNLHRS